MNYTQAQIDRANAVSLEDFLRTQGETLIKSGREYRWKEHDSLTVRGNKWFRHSQSKGGYEHTYAPLLVSSKRAHRGQKCKLNNKWLSNFLYNKHLGRKNATNDTIEKQEKSEDLCPRFSRIYFA